MKINLSPVDGLPSLLISKEGDILTINGEAFDFGPLDEGDELPVEAIASSWFAAPVQRVNGELIVSVLLPLPENYSYAQAFPEPLTYVPDGSITLPQAQPGFEFSQEPIA